MKKLISVLLVISVFFGSVFALFSSCNFEAATDIISTNVATVIYQVGNNKQTLGSFDTLDAAFEAVGTLYKDVLTANITDSPADEDDNNNNELYEAAGRPVIRLNGNIKGDECAPSWALEWYDAANVPTIVIDGAKNQLENFSITCGAITLFDQLAFYNLTVRNVDMIFDRGSSTLDNNMRWDGNVASSSTDSKKIPGTSFTVFENCLMDQNSTLPAANGSGSLFKMNGFQKAYEIGKDPVESDIYNLTLKDCIIYSDTAIGLMVHWGADANINLKNTVWTLDGKTGVGNNNDALFKAYESGDVHINIDGTSKIIAERTEGCETVALIRNLSTVGGICTYEFEKGAELYMNNNSSKLKEQYFVADGNGSSVIIDHGAKYRISESSISKVGVTLPSLKNIQSTSIGFVSDNTMLSPGDITKTPGDYSLLGYSEEEFGMIDGASVRMVKGEDGIRFSAYMSSMLLESLGSDPDFGIVIVPANDGTTDPAVAPDAVRIKCTKLQRNNAYGDNVFHAAIIMPDGIDAKTLYTTSFAARAYFVTTLSNGDKHTVYSTLTDENVRSMYQVAKTLTETNDEYKNHDIIKKIIDVSSAPGADDIMAEIAPNATVLKSSPTCSEIILSNADKDVILERLTSFGFSAITVNAIEGAKFETIVMKYNGEIITMYWNESTRELRIMWESEYKNALEVLSPTPETGIGIAQIIQIGTDRVSENDNPLNGMCYIIKLSNGRAIIIDGGFSNTVCAENLYNSLSALDIAKDDQGRFIIEAWIFSHPHGDHYGTAQVFSSMYRDTTTVNYIVHNLPGDIKASTNEATLVNKLDSYYPEAKRVNPHAGLKYYFGNITISALYTPEMIYSYSGALGYSNDTSIVLKVELGGASVLFFGDSGEEAAKAIRLSYSDDALKSDIIQITHHGLYTAANDGHTWTYLKQVYEASGATYAFLPMHSRYGTGSGTRNGRFTVMIQWCNSKYQISYVMNESDKHGKSSISQSYYDSFVDSVMAGTNTYDTLYGYNGINKIVNEQGMITYTGGNNFEPMITAFTFQSGNVTLNINSELDLWLAENHK